MPAPSPEQNFVRYRDHGDLPALAAVFDALAGHLLLVASHLVRDGALAEDLVQTTFVEAMRSAARYDAARPLLPWLVRILTHHAKKLRQKRGRPDDPRPQRRQAHDSAADHVLDREVMATVERALAELPTTYRQVLTLRLVHDLSPTAIAHALGCPPNTVKTRLKRGLSLLRQNLPSGIATLLAVTLATGRGLAAVRADVMLQAGRTALRAAKTTALLSLPLGVLLMSQFLLRTVLVAIVLVLCWFGVEAWSPGTARPAVAAPGAVREVAAIEPMPAIDASMRATVATSPVAGGPEVVFHGRCIDANTGKPLPGVAASACWIRPSPKLPHEGDPADALDHALTDAAGEFRLVCALTEALLFRVCLNGGGLLSREGAFGPYPKPQLVELGDLSMHTGVAVATRVVDQRGQPVAGVTFAIDQLAYWSKPDEPLAEFCGPAGCTRADGTVPWVSTFQPGRYRIRWNDDAIPPERNRAEMIVPEHTASLANEILWPVEDERQAIRGIVTDEFQHAVGGLGLSAEGAGTRGYGVCDGDGRFVIPRIGPYDEAQLGPVTIALRNVLDGYELAAPRPCEWGRQDVRLIVRPVERPALTVRAIDSRTAKPTGDCVILCAASLPGTDTAPQVTAPRTTVLADGSVQLAVASMPHLIQVLPKDPSLAPSAVLHWDPETGYALTVELQPTKLVDVVVVTGQGDPVAGSVVWTLQPIEGAVGQSAPMQEVPMPSAYAVSLAPLRRWQYFGIDDATLDHGITDTTGRVRLHVPTATPVLIAAFGPGHVPRAVVTSTASERIELQVHRGAAVHFELSPPELLPLFLPSARDMQVLSNLESSGKRQRAMCWATRSYSEQDPEHPQPSVVSDVTGASCTCNGLTPGTYDLKFYARLGPRVHDLSVLATLATVVLHEDEDLVVPIDLRRWATGTVHAQVLVNGQPWAFGVGSLVRQAMNDVEVYSDAEGRFEADMLCGACRFHLRSMFDHSTYWCAAQPITVVAGTTTELTIDVRRVTAVIHLLTDDDQPAAAVTVRMACASEPEDQRTWTTDAHGVVTIDPAPLSSFRLLAMSRDAAESEEATGVPLDDVQVPSTGTVTEFQLRLPAGWR